jgi:hypothetical protein
LGTRSRICAQRADLAGEFRRCAAPKARRSGRHIARYAAESAVHFPDSRHTSADSIKGFPRRDLHGPSELNSRPRPSQPMSRDGRMLCMAGRRREGGRGALRRGRGRRGGRLLRLARCDSATRPSNGSPRVSLVAHCDTPRSTLEAVASKAGRRDVRGDLGRVIAFSRKLPAGSEPATPRNEAHRGV